MENQYIVKGEKYPFIRGIPVKTTKTAFIVVFVLSLCVFSGLVAAAVEQSSLSAVPVFSKQALNVGSSVTIRITVQSSADEQLSISHIGVNFDWMDSSGFYGPNLSDDPAVIPASGSYTTPPFNVLIPTNVTVGPHNYFIGVDGTDSSETEFYWNSTLTTITVVPANTTGTTTQPTTNPTGTGGGGTSSSTSPLTLIITFAVVAVVAIVVIVLVIMLVQKRRKPKPSTPATTAPVAPATEQPKKPEEENYSI
jgi:hypothetical protein